MRTSRLNSILLPFFVWTALHLTADVDSALVASCSFEEDMCSWSKPSWSDGSWRRSFGSTTGKTGPLSSESSVGGSRFITLLSEDFRDHTNVVQRGKSVVLLTPEFQEVKTIAFLYMKHGADTIGDLTIGVAKNGTKLPTTLWTKTGKTQNVWQCEAVDVAVENKAVYFEAISSTILGDIAMDQIMLFDTSFPPQTACLSILNGSALITTPTPTTVASTSTLTPTPTVSTAPSSSPTAGGDSSPPLTSTNTITTEKKEEEEGLDTVILTAVGIPLVVLVIAGIIALVCYRRKRDTTIRLRRESAAQQNPPPSYIKDYEEDYDVIGDPDAPTDHYDTIKNTHS